ncbi:DUF3793 family protein [Clostridium drakei]|uniref:DUF3793 domain-containing protein n=1 Tax=Clostridium drakei TaxID=332101 RepID=A0A2U8DSF6_9CLOT|nr:DUF3793 family protein [Clostridium drakei]AWI05568.1 hypothetical protein B9W14_14000 [Clostridium drakei]
MGKEELKKFFIVTNNYDDLEYLFSVIVCSAGPTIKKYKASSLITFGKNNRNLNSIWEKYKNEVKEILDIDYFELKKDAESTIVLFFNKEKIELNVRESKNVEFLKRFGYNENMSVEQSLTLLSKRFEHMCPHEIGIFLGYPVEDVTAFIDCPNAECKMIGYWKVYHDIKKAKAIFNKYDEIKYTIMKLMIKGIKPTELLRS